MRVLGFIFEIIGMHEIRYIYWKINEDRNKIDAEFFFLFRLLGQYLPLLFPILGHLDNNKRET